MKANIVQWLLESDEPWTRHRTQLDLCDRPPSHPEVQASRAEMLAHPQIQALIDRAAAWPGGALKRHNDAAHALHAMSTLADFGLQAEDPGLDRAVEAVLAHQSDEGAFQTLLNIHPRFGGDGHDTFAWMACDAPVLLYALLGLGLADRPAVERALRHLLSLVQPNGWRCQGAAALGGFRGPGRLTDPCPVACVYALKALSLVPELLNSSAVRKGAAMLLWHWQHRHECKFYLFGIGQTFSRLKYPLIWYDIMHVVEVLSRFPFLRHDPHLREMLVIIEEQADADGRYTAGSIFRAWQGWSFADKTEPSPWLTFLVLRIQARLELPAAEPLT
jgi:hypothetical protein